MIKLGTVADYKHIPLDILTNPRDDCDHVCGRINIEPTGVKNCKDPDKRRSPILIINDPENSDDEKTQYFDPLDRECAEKCPKNFQIFNKTNICVKDLVQFENDLIAIGIVPSPTEDSSLITTTPAATAATVDIQNTITPNKSPKKSLNVKLVILWSVFGCLVLSSL
ncbi:unnamed protein product [Chironomus riparius]|uniref:Uncharacterized protein n=1 Tax=Chironomus riparius TaxID=315576 RepID=A0A9N9S8L9_9DIPT|nr:unnamed protein product [Chironomus riparius]